MTLNYNWITSRIAVGGEVQGNAADELARTGITHVVNCQVTPDDYGPHHFSALHLPTPDDGKPKPASWFKQGVEFALNALQSPQNKIYVHCRGGNQRGPSMAYALLRALGFAQADAYALLLQRRPSMLQYDHVVRYRHDADRAIHELGYE